MPAHVTQDPKRHVKPQTARRRNTKTSKSEGEERKEKEKQRGVKLRQLGLGPSTGQGLVVCVRLVRVTLRCFCIELHFIPHTFIISFTRVAFIAGQLYEIALYYTGVVSLCLCSVCK